jgi:hypothetical protein
LQPDDPEIVTSETFTDARTFLHELLPLNRKNAFDGGASSDPVGAMVYRGHSDDRYQLIPAALRSAGVFKDFGFRDVSTTRAQIQTEATILWKFFELADTQGLPLPEDSQRLRSLLYDVIDQKYLALVHAGDAEWPPKELWSLCAMAQHYGVPTRLLDWTRNPLTAVYFVVAGALSASLSNKGEIEDRHLSVWAFNFPPEMQNLPDRYPLVRITAPHFGNSNLHAQDGLFTMVKTDLKKLESPADRTDLALSIKDWAKASSTRRGSHECFFRYRLPWSQAAHAMHLLHELGITRARIFPGFEGVVGAIREEAQVKKIRTSR